MNRNHLSNTIYPIILINLIISFLPLYSMEKPTHNEIIQRDKDSLEYFTRIAKTYSNNGEFLKAEETINKGFEYVAKISPFYTQHGYPLLDLNFTIHYASGWNKFYLREYSQAEMIFNDLLKQLPDSCHLYISKSYTGLSSTYGIQTQYDLSEEYALLALKEAQLAHDNEAIYFAQANLGDIYLETGQLEKALEKYLETRKLSVIIGKNEAITSGNLALVHHKLGKIGLAEGYYNEALKLSKDSLPVIYSIIFPTYCELLIEKGEVAKAKELVLEAISDPRYTQMKEYNLQYFALINKLYKKPETSFNNLIWLLIGIIGGGVLVYLFSIKILRNRYSNRISQQTALQLIEEEEHLSEQEINNPNTLKLISLLELLPHINTLLEKIKYKATHNPEILSSVNELDSLLSPLSPEKMEKEISFYIESQNKDFYEKLKNAYPELNLTDLRLCTLIKMGMNTKEIAMFTHKSVRGIESAKFRLRKKMNLESSKDLYDYFLELEKEI